MTPTPDPLAELRRRAEAQVEGRTADGEARQGEDDLPALMHALRVHQVELELQNQSLRGVTAELEASRDRYSELYDLAPVGYLTLDSRGRIVELNLAACKLLGHERARLEGKYLTSLLAAGEDTRRLNTHLRAVFRGGEHQVAEVRLRDARTLELHSHTPDGRRCLTAALDVTRRVMAESELDTLADNVPAQFAYVGADRRYRYVNRRYEVVFGRRAEHIVGLSVEQLLGRANYSSIRPYLEAALEGVQATFGTEVELPIGRRTMNVTLVPDQDAAHRVVGCYALVDDVTELTRAHRALEHEQARLAAIVAGAGNGILTVDGAGRIRDFNPAAERIFRCPARRAAGRPVVEFIPCDGAAAGEGDPMGCYRERYALVEDSLRREVTGRCADGTPVPLTLTVSAVDGLDLYVLVVNDISQRRHLERDVVRAAAAEQARIGREIHDGVGQGLTATGMLAASLVHDLESAGCAAPARRAQELSQHLQGLAQEMRTLARGLSPVELDPEGLSDALAALARSVPEGRFSHAGTVRLRDDTAATHLYRIAQEAVNNALKHASARRIDIRLECRGRKVILSVEDDGCGIVPMRRRRGRLGLAIMRYRAQALGGRLEVAPRPDGGTRVRCVVPLHSEGG